MASIALPPELRTICRKLTATRPEKLPALLPTLLKDVLRCQEPLSRPQEAKTTEASSESLQLVNKLKVHISTLITGRVAPGHFVGTALAKAVVEAGGWECLRSSEPWVGGMISILQKKELMATKELCVVTLTKILVLMHDYPTLVREIVTPNLPSFANACLQILRPPTSSKAPKASLGLIETIFEALSTLIPLYPTTLRQFSAKFRGELRPFLAPTTSDHGLVPTTLQVSSRRLVVRLHMTASKAADATEWSKHMEELVKSIHMTADHVFRAVQEMWESALGYNIQPTNLDIEPQGGGDNAEQLPHWVGVQAGSERLVGLLDFVAEYVRCRTKSAVTVPISAIIDVTARISSIMPPSPGKQKSESVQMNPAVGREEKDELWSVFPDIQVGAMKLLLALVQRLEKNAIPIAPEVLDQTLRMFQAGYRFPQFRAVAFALVRAVLQISGPTLPKLTVEGFSLVIKSCCRDLLGAAGHIKRPKQQSPTSQNGSKSRHVTQNADAFLSTKTEDEFVKVSLDGDHLLAAEALLAALFSDLPQQHLPSALRSQMLKTAILSGNKDAQVASVLHPSRDRSGRMPQVILPYLSRQFPREQSVEILRFNFRPLATGSLHDMLVEGDEMAIDGEEEVDAKRITHGVDFSQPFQPMPSQSFGDTPPADQLTKPTSPITASKFGASAFLSQPPPSEIITEVKEASTVQAVSSNSLKRKSEDAAKEMTVSKRIEIDSVRAVGPRDAYPPAEPSARPVQAGRVSGPGATGARDEEDESDNESVHLNMELDSDDEDEDDDE
ncbi:rRNA processing/ribosome biogenesis-domain-containing protein [Xylariomycetidae sp. FL0641]|nr:rRNA processing/ribosome biogenesis-domain-containing protein [Xylariomycetidae sp. FL0641]